MRSYEAWVAASCPNAWSATTLKPVAWWSSKQTVRSVLCGSTTRGAASPGRATAARCSGGWPSWKVPRPAPPCWSGTAGCKVQSMQQPLEIPFMTQSKSKHFAVVGAGMAGVACARTLVQAGHQVTVFEKSAGIGGRMATRNSAFGTFDLGAQYFTCLLYTSDAADDLLCVDLGGRRIIK